MSEDATETSLPKDAETLRTLALHQAEAMAKLLREFEQLKFAYQKLLQDRYGRKSEKLAAGQLALFELTDESPASEPPPIADEPEPKSQRRRGGGRRKLPNSLPREVIEHDLSDEEKCCPGCGVVRERIGSETSEQLEFIPATLKVLEHVRYK